MSDAGVKITVTTAQRRVGDMYKKVFEDFGLSVSLRIVPSVNPLSYPRVSDGVHVYEGFDEVEEFIDRIEQAIKAYKRWKENDQSSRKYPYK